MLKPLLPVVYLLSGFLVFSRFEKIKQQFSYVLTRIFIPAAIIINLSHNFIKSALMIIFFFLSLCVLSAIGKKIEKQPLFALCFCYLNIGWLGLPMSVLFLTKAQWAILLNAYIGNSIFGNTVGVHTLLTKDRQVPLKKLFLQPTVIAVLIGTALAVIPFNFYTYFKSAETSIHICMSFLGMSVLGMWLKQHRINRESLKNAVNIQLKKFGIFSLLAILLYLGMKFSGIENLKDIIIVLMYICILPPAANIIVLETYYCSEGKTAPLIVSGTLVSMGLLALLTLIVLTRPYFGV